MIHTPARQDFREIFNLSQEFMQPKDAERAMKRNFLSKFKLQEKIILKDRLSCLKYIGSNETQSFAQKICNKIKYDREDVMERVVKFIMNLKVEDALKDIKEEKEKVRKAEEEVNAIFRPSTVAGIEYNKFVKENLEYNWKNKKEESKRIFARKFPGKYSSSVHK